MIRVIIESPFAGANAEERAHNVEYARAAARDSVMRGESPYLSHLFFTQFLDDDVPEQRTLGIEAGLKWGEVADRTVVYTDRGISRGMQLGIDRAIEQGRPVEYRKLGTTLPRTAAPHREVTG